MVWTMERQIKEIYTQISSLEIAVLGKNLPRSDFLRSLKRITIILDKIRVEILRNEIEEDLSIWSYENDERSREQEPDPGHSTEWWKD